MIDKFKIDSHKLIYHPDRVADWLKGETIYPIEIEISPSGACNHRCTFCAVDYIGYHSTFLDKSTLVPNMLELKKRGLKSVICSGEGEPLLNPEMPDMANQMSEMGLDVAMSTNGVLLDKEKADECLGAFTWIRYSIASFENKSYQSIHRCKEEDLQRVKRNLADAVEIKIKNNLKVTLGVQCLLIPDNEFQLVNMAKELREIGVDYFTIKPYSQHLHSKNRLSVDYQKLLELEKELESVGTEQYNVIFRSKTMKKIHRAKRYDKCYGLPFMTHIDAKGNVWPCVAHIGEEKFCYGNINESSFIEIWEGERRKKAVEALQKGEINSICREACRLDEINEYLFQLKNPMGHVNFI